MGKKRKVILGIGSNIGDRRAYIEQAISELEQSFLTSIIRSSIYETEPWGFKAETSFLNCCVGFKSSQNPEKLLEITQKIEKKLGRSRKKNKNNYQSRTIDIDLLFVGDIEMKNKKLEIPHPRLYDRSFVLIPILELFPDFIDPSSKLSIQELVDRCNDKNKVLLYRD